MVLKLTEQEEKVLQKLIAVELASQRFHRYELLRNTDSNFEEKEAQRRFKLLKTYLRELINYCVNCGSDGC